MSQAQHSQQSQQVRPPQEFVRCGKELVDIARSLEAWKRMAKPLEDRKKELSEYMQQVMEQHNVKSVELASGYVAEIQMKEVTKKLDKGDFEKIALAANSAMRLPNPLNPDIFSIVALSQIQLNKEEKSTFSLRRPAETKKKHQRESASQILEEMTTKGTVPEDADEAIVLAKTMNISVDVVRGLKKQSSEYEKIQTAHRRERREAMRQMNVASVAQEFKQQ